MNKLKLKHILFCLIGFSISITALAQPLKEKKFINLNYGLGQEYIINTIDVSGAKYLDNNTIIALSGLKIGDKITIPSTTLSDATSRIWKENIVGNISFHITAVNGNKIDLLIKLTEKPRLGKVYIEGVRKGEESDIKEMLSLVRSQVIFSSFEKDIEVQVGNYFKEKGFYNVKVNPRPINDSTVIANHISYKIDVEKGAKVKISDIIIEGEKEIEEKYLLRKMKKTKKVNFFRIFKRSKYIKEEYEEDKQRLLALYNAKGMRDASITYDTVYNVEDDRLEIKMKIFEGNKYYFRNITWVGNNIYRNGTLDTVLAIQKGDIYNKDLLDQRLNFNPTGIDVSSMYLDNGYLFYNLQPIEVRVSNDSIDIEMRIYEGQKAKIGNIYIKGNNKTSDHVIYREIRTIPGEDFSRSDIIRTQRELAALGYFDPQQIGIVPKPNPATGTVDIEYTLVEKPSDQLQLSGGWGGGGFGFVGSLGLSFSNFSLRKIPKLSEWSPLPAGDGQSLSLRAQTNGKFYQNYSISFTEPWLGGKKPNALSVSLFRSISNRFDDDQNKDGSLKVTGVTVSLGKRLRWPDDYFYWSNGLSYNRFRTDNYAVSSAICDNCHANNFNFNTTLARDDRGNNPQYYTNGGKISLSVSVTPPYSLISKRINDLEGDEKFKYVEYHKWMFDWEKYMQLTGYRKKAGSLSTDQTKQRRSFVLQTRAHFGYVGRLNTSKDVTPFERFELGGSGLSGFGGSFLTGRDIIGLRGYEDGSLTLNGQYGTIMSKYVMELRYPLVLEGIATIYALGFLEAGNIWGSPEKFNPTNLKRSYGGGLRIFMPAFGLLGLDYGVGIDQIPGNPNANRGQIHFSIGQMIR